MNLNIPKITSSIRKVDLSSLSKVDFSNVKKIDMSKMSSIYPNPKTVKVNFLEAVMKYIEKFCNK